MVFGGTLLWSSQGTYALASAVGFRGESTIRDAYDDCTRAGCNLHRYEFNTSGFMLTSTVGHVFDLGGPSGAKLDLRGSLGYAQNRGDAFRQFIGYDQSYAFSTWNTQAGATLFTNIVGQNGGLLRPYIQATIRHDFDYSNSLTAVDVEGTSPGLGGQTFSTENHTFGGLTAGVAYNIDRLTFGAAVYTESSGDERSLGGRLGVSYLLGGSEPAPRERARSDAVPFNWTGAYLGVNAGGAASNISMVNLGPVNPFEDANTMPSKGWMAGGQLGYNLQFASAVFGLEGAWSNIAMKHEHVNNEFAEDHWQTDVSQLFSVTGRVGVAVGDWLPYVKAGYAGIMLETEVAPLVRTDFPLR